MNEPQFTFPKKVNFEQLISGGIILAVYLSCRIKAVQKYVSSFANNRGMEQTILNRALY